MHTLHRLQTTFSPAQEVQLRKTLLLPLDDSPVVTREFIHPEASRSGLDRCLRRHGVSNLKALMPMEDEAEKPIHKKFKSYEPGFVHVDVKYRPRMPDETHRKHLFAAIDRATRWVYVEILPDKSATSARVFLKRLIKKASFKINKVLTGNGNGNGNGNEFTDHFCATGKRQPTGFHVFDQVCVKNHIEHRLIKPRTPQTVGSK